MTFLAPYVASLPIYEKFAEQFNSDPNNPNNYYLEKPGPFYIDEHLKNYGTTAEQHITEGT